MPTITSFSPASGPIGATVTINGTGFSGASEVSLCLLPTTFTLVSSTRITAAVPAGACDGLWRVTTPGGTAASSNAFTVTSPTISSVSPTSGAVGSTVTINGTNFSGASQVSLCLVPTTFTLVSSTRITATVPAGACDGLWRVTTPAGTAASEPFTVSSGSLTISGFAPTSGAVGSTVTISGSGFSGATQVSLCLVPTLFTVFSATTITATVPAGACDGRWRVTTAAGTAASEPFTVSTGSLTISGFSPSSGGDGATVTISGSGFSGATQVSLCLVPTSFTPVSATTITATVPDGACDGLWRVTTPTGTAASAAAFTNTSPTITNFSPGSGPVGTTVTINGTNFNNASQVSLCLLPTTFTPVSATRITAAVPTGACDGLWRVTTPTGTAASNTVFLNTGAADTTPPSVPQGLRISGSTQSTITMAWNASTDNVAVTGYRTYLNDAALATTQQLSYTYTGLQCGTTYSLSLEAYDAAGNSSYRPEAVAPATTATCPGGDTTPPSTPTGLVAAPNQTSISLSWTASTDNVGVAGYSVYQAASNIGSTAGTTYNYTGLSCNTSYTLAVDAYDAAANHSTQATITSTTTACSPPPGSATVFMSPSGSDGNPCSQAQPCQSFDRAYRVAASGATVEVAAGSYPGQTINPDGSKTSTADVLFRPAAGASVTVTGEIEANGAHFEFRDMTIHQINFPRSADDITLRNVINHGMWMQGPSNISILGGEITCGACGYHSHLQNGGADAAPPRNILFDGVNFHDWGSVAGEHVECLQILGGDNVIIRNSIFKNCGTANGGLGATADLHIAWVPTGTAMTKNILLENNFFYPSGNAYAIQMDDYANIDLRYNSISGPILIFDRSGPGTGIDIIGNILRASSCTAEASGVPINWRYNVSQGGTCGATDKNASAGFVDPNNNLHLTTSSAAINAGDPTSYPSRDIDAQTRPTGSSPDAGADEAG